MNLRRLAAGLLLCCCTVGSARAQSPNTATKDALRAAAIKAAGPDAVVCDVALRSGTVASGTFFMSVDYTGRHFCNTVFIVRTGRYGRVLQEIGVWRLDDFSTALVDLNADGRQELVADSLVTDYEGAQCRNAVPVIYACTATRCTNSGTTFAGYLRERLAEAEAALASSSDADFADGNDACAIVTRDKLRRMLGIDARAGFDTALQWLESGDELRALKGLLVLADIGDEDAMSRVEAISRGTGAVAERARQFVTRVK